MRRAGPGRRPALPIVVPTAEYLEVIRTTSRRPSLHVQIGLSSRRGCSSTFIQERVGRAKEDQRAEGRFSGSPPVFGHRDGTQWREIEPDFHLRIARAMAESEVVSDFEAVYRRLLAAYAEEIAAPDGRLDFVRLVSYNAEQLERPPRARRRAACATRGHFSWPQPNRRMGKCRRSCSDSHLSACGRA